MDLIAVHIASPYHAPHQISLTASRNLTIQQLKMLVRLQLQEPRPATTELVLLYKETALNDSDKLESVLDMTRMAPPYPAVELTVCPSRLASPIALDTIGHVGLRDCGPTMHAQPATANGTGTTCRRRQTAQDSSEIKDGGSFVPPPVMLTNAHHYEFAIVNGMPYLIPSFMPRYFGQQHFIPMNPPSDGIQQPVMANHTGVPQQSLPQQPVQDAAAWHAGLQDLRVRNQRRAAAMWLILKLALAVFVLGFHGSIERTVLLSIVALVIFLHQTGRLRIIRRVVVRPPPTTTTTPPPPPQQQQQQQQQRQQQQQDAPLPGGSVTEIVQPAQSARQDAIPPSKSSALSSSSQSLDLIDSKQRVDSGSSGSSNSGGSSSSMDCSQAKTELDGRTLTQDTTAEHQDSTKSRLDSETHHLRMTEPEVAEEQSEAGSTSEDMPGHELQQQQQPMPESVWRKVEHGLYTFVASLIPTPHDMDPVDADLNAIDGERVL